MAAGAGAAASNIYFSLFFIIFFYWTLHAVNDMIMAEIDSPSKWKMVKTAVTAVYNCQLHFEGKVDFI